MKILVLGCGGKQGKAVLFHTSDSDQVSEIICADYFPEALDTFTTFTDMDKVRIIKGDVSSKAKLISIMKQGIDVVVDVLPSQYTLIVAEAAIESGVNLVNTNYSHPIRHLHKQAFEKNISIMPECGLDPGIDLVIYGHCAKKFDEIYIMNSYCGGIPEKEACNNPLNYKISWNWEATIRAQKRKSVLIKDGKKVTISPDDQHNNEMIHEIEFNKELGKLEAFPNGDTTFYTDLLNVTKTIKEAGRYSLRWPGWCSFWDPLKKLKFLSEEHIVGLSKDMTPFQFVVRLLDPQLQYKENEKDIVVMRNIFVGNKNRKKRKIVSDIFIEKDINTRLSAMSQGVGFTASIVAQMIGTGEISNRGILSPVLDIPYNTFKKRLDQSGIKINEKIYTD
jgi:saccharopine dehydrogenase-like NADP-dependent oxidoreductase